MLLCYQFYRDEDSDPLELLGFPAKNVTCPRCAALRLAVHLNLHNRKGWKSTKVSAFNSNLEYHYHIGAPLNCLMSLMNCHGG